MQYQYGGYSLQAQTMGVPNAKYKTMLCRHYEATNQCSVGAKCQFAHGQAELRSINDPIPPSAMSAISQAITQPAPQHNYKSIQCKYHGMGFCKNGTNCTFIHEDPDPYMQQQMPNEMQQQMHQQMPQSQYQQPQQQQYYQGNQYQKYNIKSTISQMYQQQQQQQQQQQPPQQNNATLQQFLDQQVLLMILRDLEAVFSYREDLVSILKEAVFQVQAGNNGSGSQAIKSIVHNSDLSNEEKAQYQTIYDRAKVYLVSLQQQYQPQKQQ